LPRGHLACAPTRFFGPRRAFCLGTPIATPVEHRYGDLNAARFRSLRRANHPRSTEESIMGNRMFWAFLWVIGLPLPLVIILYMLFGHHG